MTSGDGDSEAPRPWRSASQAENAGSIPVARSCRLPGQRLFLAVPPVDNWHCVRAHSGKKFPSDTKAQDQGRWPSRSAREGPETASGSAQEARATDGKGVKIIELPRWVIALAIVPRAATRLSPKFGLVDAAGAVAWVIPWAPLSHRPGGHRARDARAATGASRSRGALRDTERRAVTGSCQDGGRRGSRAGPRVHASPHAASSFAPDFASARRDVAPPPTPRSVAHADVGDSRAGQRRSGEPEASQPGPPCEPPVRLPRGAGHGRCPDTAWTRPPGRPLPERAMPSACAGTAEVGGGMPVNERASPARTATPPTGPARTTTPSKPRR